MSKEYLAIVPVHGRMTLVEGKEMTEVRQGVEQVLEQPRIVYPNYDFDKDIVLIRGKRKKWKGGI